MSDLARIKGVSFDTYWSLHPSPSEVSIPQLALDSDPRWISCQSPWHPDSYRRPHSFVKWYIHLHFRDPSYRDSWITPADVNTVFHTEDLGFIGDMTLPILDNFCGDEGCGSHAACVRLGRDQEQDRKHNVSRPIDPESGNFTTPITSVTLSYNMEIKKALPPQGTRWLFTRSRARRIENGRMDNEISILDETNDLVAIVQQVHQIINLTQAMSSKAKM